MHLLFNGRVTKAIFFGLSSITHKGIIIKLLLELASKHLSKSTSLVLITLINYVGYCMDVMKKFVNSKMEETKRRVYIHYVNANYGELVDGRPNLCAANGQPPYAALEMLLPMVV